MNLRKFISGVSAFAIAASAFAGMAVTANAAAVAYGDYTSIEAIIPLWTDGGNGGAYKKSDKNGSWVQVHDGDYIELDTTKNYIITILGKGASSNLNQLGFLQLQTASGDSLISAEKTNWNSTETVTITVNNTDTTKASTISQTGGASYEGTQVKSTDADAVVGRIAVRDTNSAADYQYRIYPTLSIVNPDTSTNMTYTETNGLNPVIALKDSEDNDVSNTATVENGDYTYTAKLPGYNTVYGSFTAEGGNKNVEFTMSAIPSAPSSTNDTAAKSKDMTLLANGYHTNESVDISELGLAVGDDVVIEYDMFVAGDCNGNILLSGNSNSPVGANFKLDAYQSNIYGSTDRKTSGTNPSYSAGNWAHVKMTFSIVADTSEAASDNLRTTTPSVVVTPQNGTASAELVCDARNLATGFKSISGNGDYKIYNFDRVKFSGEYTIANAEMYVLATEADPHAEAFTFEKTADQFGSDAKIYITFKNNTSNVTQTADAIDLGTTFTGAGSANIAVVITDIADGYSVKSVTIE